MPSLAVLLVSTAHLVSTAAAAPLPAASACATRTSTSDVQAALELAEAAYADADLPALEAALQRAEDDLPCVVEVISRPLAARYHRARGLAAFVDGRAADAERAFAAGRSIQPAYTFPAEIVPPGNPVLDHYIALDVSSPKTLPVDAPARGSLYLDGRVSTDRSVSWPVLVQLTDDLGAVTTTAWLQPGDDLPAYVPAPEPSDEPTLAATPAPAPDPPDVPSPLKRKLPWIVGASATAATSVTLFAVSRGAASTYRDPATTGEAELDGLRSTANGLLYTSGGLGVVAVGLGTVAIVF